MTEAFALLDNLLGSYTSLVLTTSLYVVFSIVVLFIIRSIRARVRKSQNTLDDYIFKALYTPLRILLVIIGGYIVLGEFAILMPESSLNSLLAYFDSIIIIWIIITIFSGITYMQKYFLSKQHAHVDTILLISKISKIAIVTVLALSLFQSLGFDISSVLAFGGIGGLVVGMAAKDMLANIFGGIMVNLDKPFSIGDWIRVNDVEGTVEHIGWRTTQVRTFSKNPVYIPNSHFSTASIETPSRMTNRRIYEVIGLRYDDIAKVKDIMSETEQMLKSHEYIDPSAITMVYFQTFNESSLDIIVYTFTKTTNWSEYQSVKSDILLDIYKIIERHEADIAYPTQTLKLEQNA